MLYVSRRLRFFLSILAGALCVPAYYDPALNPGVPASTHRGTWRWPLAVTAAVFACGIIWDGSITEWYMRPAIRAFPPQHAATSTTVWAKAGGKPGAKEPATKMDAEAAPKPAPKVRAKKEVPAADVTGQPAKPAKASTKKAAEGAEPKERKGKKQKKEVDFFAPKRPPSSYLRFASVKRPLLKQKYPEKTVTEIATMLGKLWNELPDNEKQPYIQEYEKDRKQYMELKAEISLEEDDIFLKRPLTAYMLFMAEMRAAMKSRGTVLSPRELVTEIAGKWQELNGKDREKYVAKAQQLKETWVQDKKLWEDLKDFPIHPRTL